MEFLPFDTNPETALVGLPRVPTEEREFGSVLGAAFRQESPFAAIGQAVTAPQFETDENFDIVAASKDDPLADRFGSVLGAARSADEYSYLRQQIYKEQRDKETIAQAGVSGIFASMAAGMLSPTMGIPIVGAARGLKGMAQAFALAGGAVTADEIALYGLQKTRTREEVVGGIAAGTILGGLLGSSIMYLAPAAKTRLASGMALRQGDMTISHLDESGAVQRVDVQTIDKTRSPVFVSAEKEVRDLVGKGITAEDVKNLDQVKYEAMIAKNGGREIVVALGLDTPAKFEDFITNPDKHSFSREQLIAAFETTKAVQRAQKVDVQKTVQPEQPSAITLKRREISGDLVAAEAQLKYLQDTVASTARGSIVGPEGKAKFAVQIGSLEQTVKNLKNEVEKLKAAEEAEKASAPVSRPAAPVPPPMGHNSANAKIDEKINQLRTAEEFDEAPAFRAANDDAAAPPESTVGARTTVEAPGRRLDTGPNRVSRAIVNSLAKLNPVTRVQNNKYFGTARIWMGRIMSPVRLEGNAKFQPYAGEGDMYHRSLVHQRLVAPAIRALDDAYARHILGNVPDDGTPAQAWLQNLRGGLFKPPAGKMSRQEFMTEAFRLANTGEEVLDPNMAKAVDAQRKYYDEVDKIVERYYSDRVREVGEDGAVPMYKKQEFSEDNDIQHYIHHMFNGNIVTDKLDEFIADFSDFGEKLKRSAFRKSHERYQAAREGLEAWRSILMMSQEQRDIRIDELDQGLEQLRGNVKEDDKALRELSVQMKEQGASPEDIKSAREEMRAGFGTAYQDVKQQIKKMVREHELLMNAGAKIPERQKAVRAEIAKVEELQHTALVRVMDAGAAFRKKWTGISDKALDAEQQKLWDKFKTELDKLSKYTKQLYSTVDADDVLKVQKRYARHTAADERVNKIVEKIEASEGFDRELARELLITNRDWFLQKWRDIDGRRNSRVAKLEEKLDELNDAERKVWQEEFYREQTAKVNEDLNNLDGNFEDIWRDRGGEDVRARTGGADFSAIAREDAIALALRITGQPNRVAGLDVIGGERGAELARVLQIPFETKIKYLETDPEKIIRSHAHHIFPDMELYRATGSVNGARIFDDLQYEYQARAQEIINATHVRNGYKVGRRYFGGEPVLVSGSNVPDGYVPITRDMRDKINADMQKEYRQVVRDLTVVVDRFRHQRGIPEDGNGFGYRLGRAVMNANVFRFMGTVAISSLPDLARPIFTAGLSNTFQHSWKPMLTNWKQIKATRQEAYRLGLALDPTMHNRPQAVFDVGENYSSRQNLFERGLEFAAQKTGFVALFDEWTSMNKVLSSNVTFNEMGHYLREFVENGPDAEKAADFLHWAGLNDNMIRRIWDQFNVAGGATEFDGGHKISNTEAWTDFDATMAFRAAMQKIVNDAIITPALDRPSWVDQNMAFKMLAQFRSFSFSATNRIIMSGAQRPNMALIQGTFFSIALGAMAYYTWAMARGGKSQESMQNANTEQWVYEAIARSGVLGIFGDVQRVGEQIPLLNDWAVFGGEGRATRRSNSLIGAFGGPSFDMAERLASVVQGIDDPTQSTLHNARVAMGVYQNVFYLTRALDEVERGLASGLGLPEKRGE